MSLRFQPARVRLNFKIDGAEYEIDGWVVWDSDTTTILHYPPTDQFAAYDRARKLNHGGK